MYLIIKNKYMKNFYKTDNIDFPKYTSQLINWANQNAQGTRPKIVGQLSELFPKYQSMTLDEVSIDNWKKWYLEHYPNAIIDATNKISEQINNLKEAIKLIDKKMIEKWVENLVITKTFIGMYYQKIILSYVAEYKKTNYRLSNPKEESEGIDGYIGDTAYSIKPTSLNLKTFSYACIHSLYQHSLNQF